MQASRYLRLRAPVDLRIGDSFLACCVSRTNSPVESRSKWSLKKSIKLAMLSPLTSTSFSHSSNGIKALLKSPSFRVITTQVSCHDCLTGFSRCTKRLGRAECRMISAIIAAARSTGNHEKF